MAEAATSQVQKHFIINNVYKRSRRYFDIMKLNQLEHLQEVQRRLPQASKQTIDSRVSSSFVCSNQLLTNKVGNDLDYFQHKQLPEDADQTETTITTMTKKRKVIDMKKMLNWSDLDKDKPNHRNEQQFNNFTLDKFMARNSFDFENYKSRDGRKTERISNPDKQFSQQTKVGKVRQRMLYDTSHSHCFVDYKRYSKSEGKKAVDEKPIIQMSRIRRGQSLTKKNINNLSQFYHGNGKADPSQFDNRLLKDSEYFWKENPEKQKLKDFSTAKKKEIELSQRYNRIMDRKKLPDLKEEMCDLKFFRRQPDISQ